MSLRRFLFYLVTFGFLFLFAEGLSYLSLRILFSQRKIILRSRPSDQILQSFYEKSFDPVLGWDNRPGPDRPEIGPLTERKDDGQKGTGLPEEGIAVFGDSFTFCSEVKDDETWPHYLSELTGRPVTNFGVIGYGPDQAYLKYRKVISRRRYPTVILGMNVENIGRLLNRYRGFYCCAGEFDPGFTKPRFVPEGGGLVFVPNPIRTREEFSLYLNEEGLKQISHERFPYTPLFQFPYLTAFYQALPQLNLKFRRQIGILLDRKKKRTYPYHELYNDPEAMAILEGISTWFFNPGTEPDDSTVRNWIGDSYPLGESVSDSHARPADAAEHRVFAVFYGLWEFEQYQLTGRFGNEPLLHFLKGRGWPVLDTKLPLLQVLNEKGWDRLGTFFGEGGHHSPEANRLIAGYVNKFLGSEKFIPNRLERGVPTPAGVNP